MGNGKKQAKVKIDYERLGQVVTAAFEKHAALRAKAQAGIQTHKAIAKIRFDDCTYLEFTVPGLASNERIRFEKDGHASWVETVKHSHRNNATICVTYDERDADTAVHDDEVFLVYPPSDLHDE